MWQPCVRGRAAENNFAGILVDANGSEFKNGDDVCGILQSGTRSLARVVEMSIAATEFPRRTYSVHLRIERFALCQNMNFSF